MSSILAPDSFNGLVPTTTNYHWSEGDVVMMGWRIILQMVPQFGKCVDYDCDDHGGGGGGGGWDSF